MVHTHTQYEPLRSLSSRMAASHIFGTNFIQFTSNEKYEVHTSSSHMTKIPAVKDKLKLRHILCSQLYSRSQRNKIVDL